MEKQDPSSYTNLIDKLDRFTRKYYVNRAIRGGLLFVGLVIFSLILISVLEYNFYFESGVRKVLFFSFIALAAGSFYLWIGRPLLGLLKLGKTIGHEQSAAIIGTHFTDVKDRLLNILQLRQQVDHHADTSLLLASIDQKTEQLRPVQFQQAIDYSKNRKYLKYALPPLMLFGVLLIMAPTMISEGSARIIRNNEHFEKPAPFQFHVTKADQLVSVQYADYDIFVETKGDVVPDRAFIELNEQTYQLEKLQDQSFRFTIKNIKEDLDFKLSSGEVTSRQFHVDVLKKPQFLDMKIRASYPRYTGRASEVFENNGDLVVPIGTQLSWTIEAKETSQIDVAYLIKNERNLLPFEKENNHFYSKKGVYSSLPYVLYASSVELPLADSMHYYIEAIPDQHPTLQVQSIADSLQTDIRLFTGKADDDYGLSALKLVWYVLNEKGIKTKESQKRVKPVSGLYTSFEYLFTVDSFVLQDGDELFYHFEIWDNDGIHGAKVTKSATFNYKKASLEELENISETNNEDIKKALKDNLKKTDELKKEIKELREKFLNKKELNWQDKKDAEKLLEKQEEIKKALEKARQQLQENMQNQEKFADTPEDLKEKQENLDKMMEDVLKDELQELMDEINKLLEEMKREESIDQMEKMENSSKEMELEFDKMLELFKQLEVEQQLQEEIDKLNELADKQEELSEKTQEEEKTDEELKKEQEDLSKKFDEIKKELEELLEKNKELENPRKIEDTKDLEKEIKEDQKTSEEELGKNEEKKEDQKENEEEQKPEDQEEQEEEESQEENQEEQEQSKQKAAKAQKQAGQKMKQMAQKLQEGMMGGQMDQMGEDIEMIRQLLENILTLSFDEESLVNDFNRTNKQTTKYIELVQGQFKIQDDFSLVRDSLHALSKRNDKIQSFVMEKVADIDQNLEKSLRLLEDRKKEKAGSAQRFVMTYLNDLAVMLSESMAQMQQQMSSMMPGSQMCNKPKPGQGGQKPMDKITKGQQQVKDGLQKMMQGKKEGQKPSSEDFGKMAQQQSAMRKLLRDMQKENGEKGQNNKMLQEIIESMNGLEKNLVNKQLTNEMIKRQQKIQTRLLEAEKAERQRDLDDKRESKSAEQIKKQLPPAIEAYLKERQNQLREVDRSSPLLTPYYKRLVDLYYKSLNN